MKSDVISRLLNLDSRGFEEIVVRLLKTMGFAVEATGQTGDGGIDALAHLDRPLVGGKYVIQCKRYAPENKVDVATVRDLYGVVTDERAVKGILITTSSFTRKAEGFAQGKNLELVDGPSLVKLLDDASIMNAEKSEEPSGIEKMLGLDVIEAAQRMGEEEGRRFLAQHGWDLRVDADGNWNTTAIKGFDHPVPADVFDAFQQSSQVFDVLRQHCQGFCMIAQLSMVPGSAGNQHPLFRVRKSFGAVSLEDPSDDDEWRPTMSDCVALRKRAAEQSANADIVGKWLRYEDDSEVVAEFVSEHDMPRSAYVFANLAAYHLLATEQYDEAMQYGALAVECLTEDGAPDLVVSDFVYNLAFFIGAGTSQLPQDLWRRCITRAPNNAFLRIEHAHNLAQQSREGTAEAQEMLWHTKEAARLGADNATIQAKVARLLGSKGHAAEAVGFGVKAVELAESAQEKLLSHTALAAALENSGEHAQAIMHLQEALTLDENHVDAMMGLAVAYYLHFLKKRHTLHGQGHKTLGQLEDFPW